MHGVPGINCCPNKTFTRVADGWSSCVGDQRNTLAAAESVEEAGRRAALPEDVVRRAPKVLLHDHLDGGLRPATIVELAARAASELARRDRSWRAELLESLADALEEKRAELVVVAQSVDEFVCDDSTARGKGYKTVREF